MAWGVIVRGGCPCSLLRVRCACCSIEPSSTLVSAVQDVDDVHDERPALKRAIGFPLLVLYGIGTMVGAGFFALSGEVAGKAGTHAPLAFGVAGLLALFSALAFAEWSSRLPHDNVARQRGHPPPRICLTPPPPKLGILLEFRLRGGRGMQVVNF